MWLLSLLASSLVRGWLLSQLANPYEGCMSSVCPSRSLLYPLSDLRGWLVWIVWWAPFTWVSGWVWPMGSASRRLEGGRRVRWVAVGRQHFLLFSFRSSIVKPSPPTPTQPPTHTLSYSFWSLPVFTSGLSPWGFSSWNWVPYSNGLVYTKGQASTLSSPLPPAHRQISDLDLEISWPIPNLQINQQREMLVAPLFSLLCVSRSLRAQWNIKCLRHNRQ